MLYVHVSLFSLFLFLFFFASFRQEAQPPPPCQIVINKYSDAHLLKIVHQMQQRTQIYKEKVIDPYASSPECSPPVSEYFFKNP